MEEEEEELLQAEEDEESLSDGCGPIAKTPGLSKLPQLSTSVGQEPTPMKPLNVPFALEKNLVKLTVVPHLVQQFVMLCLIKTRPIHPKMLKNSPLLERR